MQALKSNKEVQKFKGKEIKAHFGKHPFIDRKFRAVIGSETTVNVDIVEGTGAVHTAPAYGKDLQGLKDKS